MRTTGAKIYLNLAEHAAENKIMKPYCLYLSAKAKYSNSVIYKFSYYKLSKIFKIDPKTAKRYVKKLLDHNFCTIHSGNLLFRSPQKVMDDNELYVQYKNGRSYGEYVKLRIPANTTIKQIFDKVLEFRIANTILQQEFGNLSTSGKIGGYTKLGSRSETKAIINYLEEKNLSKSELSKQAKYFKPSVSKEMMRNVVISSRWVAQAMGVSHKTGALLLKRLSDNNKIVFEPVIEVVYNNINNELSDQAYSSLKEENYGYYFWGSKTKKVYRHKGCAIVYKGDVTNKKSNFVRNEYFDNMFESEIGVDPKTRKIYNNIIKSKRSPIQRKLRAAYYAFNKTNSLNKANINTNKLNNRSISFLPININTGATIKQRSLDLAYNPL